MGLTQIETITLAEGHGLKKGDQIIKVGEEEWDDEIYLVLGTGDDFICVCRSCDVTTLNNTIH